MRHHVRVTLKAAIVNIMQQSLNAERSLLHPERLMLVKA